MYEATISREYPIYGKEAYREIRKELEQQLVAELLAEQMGLRTDWDIDSHYARLLVYGEEKEVKKFLDDLVDLVGNPDPYRWTAQGVEDLRQGFASKEGKRKTPTDMEYVVELEEKNKKLSEFLTATIRTLLQERKERQG